MDMTRRAGVLLHPTSLPGELGIGEFGKDAELFIEWMAEAGQSVWQVMPLGPTGYGDSPYQCFSAFAANPMLISLERLVESGLLNINDLKSLKKINQFELVDFGKIIPVKMELLKKAFHEFDKNGEEEDKNRFETFCARFDHWLDDYAVFASLKEFHDGKPWVEWPKHHRDRHRDEMDRVHDELGDRIRYQKWLQFTAIEQWWFVRHIAKEKGVLILGDLPLFIAHDSADAWAHRHLFHFNESGRPTVVAGVPPDYFSNTGQRWGNPLYNWEAHRAEGFRWWESRIRTTLELVEWVRIDHFRGLEAYWEIPASEPTAVNGQWVKAPGAELFGTLLGRMGDLPLIAEDLGVITPEVEALKRQFNLPGMKVMQFAWGAGATNPFLPHFHTIDSVVYTGTHDNNTTVGWKDEEATGEMLQHLEDYIGHKSGAINEELLRLAYSSPASQAISPMQDLLGLGAESRMNTPGKPSGNWSWRLRKEQLTHDLATKLKHLTELYLRNPREM